MRFMTRFLILGLILAASLSAIPAAEPSEAPRMAGAGLDYSSWNGAMLVGPGGSLWGVRVGYYEGDQYVTDMNFMDHVVRTGPYAPDGSYSELRSGALRYEWSPEGTDSIVGRVEALRDGVRIIVEAYPAHDFPMRHRELPPIPYINPARFEIAGPNEVTGTSPRVITASGTTHVTGGHAEFKGRSVRIDNPDQIVAHFRMETAEKPVETGMGLVKINVWGGDVETTRVACLAFTLNKGQSVHLRARAAATPLPPQAVDASQVDQTLVAARANYEQNRVYGTGPFGKSVEPALNMLFWIVGYNPFEQKRCLSPGRRWMADGRYNLWGWDENFAGLIASVVDGDIAKLNTFLASGDERVSPLVCWTVYTRWRDRTLLEKCYPVYRGLYPPGDVKLIESVEPDRYNVGKGMDDTPMHELGRGLGPLYSLDMVCMKAWSKEILARMADELGKADDAAQYRKDRTELVEAINKTFWNAENGIYRNRYLDGQWAITETPTSFYPWLAGAPSREQSAELLKRLLDPKKFWSEYMIVTLAKDDPEYGKPASQPHIGRIFPPYCYWRGNIWPPPVYMVYEGLKRNAEDSVVVEYTHRVINLWYKNWEANNHTLENYHPETGGRSEMSDPHHAWAMLLPLTGIKEMIDIEWWGDIDALRFGSLDTEVSTIHNLPILGHRYDVRTGPLTSLTRDGKLLFEAEGAPCVVRGFNATADDRFEVKAAAPLSIRLHPPLVREPATVKVPAGRHEIRLGATIAVQSLD